MVVDILTSIIAVIIVLGIMIVVHEWGHFVAAKLFGVRVEVFSLGFGPRLWGRRRGATDYRISALPVGGYVRMAGDNPSEERKGEPDEFLSKPRWQRVLIAVAGPTMNILMAVVLTAGVFLLVGVPFPAYLSRPFQVVAVPADSAAAKAGIRPGDLITEINGIKHPTWEQAEEEVGKAKQGSQIPVVVDRGGQLLAVTVRMSDPQQVSSALGYPLLPAVIEQVAPGMPADEAGLKSGDEILALNGQSIVTWPQFAEAIRHSNGHLADVLVRRGEERIRLQVRPVQVQDSQKQPVWQIGLVNRVEVYYKRVGLATAVQQASLANVAFTRQILHIVAQLFQGRMSLKQMHGPLGIARLSGQAARRGPLDLIYLMAVLSLNLGILNLLPIPILDGGHILLLAVEGTLRRDLSVTVKERFVQVGLVFLLLVLVMVMYNDVLKMIPSK